MVITTVPYTLEQLAALQAALASGVTRVQYNGREVEYASIKDLKLAIDVVQSGINGQNGIISNRQVRMMTSKGLGFGWRSWPYQS